MIRNEYYLKARLMPTVLTMIPLVVLYLYIVAPLIDPVLNPVWDLLPVFTGVSINVAVMFLLVLLNRFLSKAIFQRLFYQDDLKCLQQIFCYLIILHWIILVEKDITLLF